MCLRGEPFRPNTSDDFRCAGHRDLQPAGRSEQLRQVPPIDALRSLAQRLALELDHSQVQNDLRLCAMCDCARKTQNRTVHADSAYM
jgi:hypothetical protein